MHCQISDYAHHAICFDQEFERKVSSALFRTVVVPFRRELYGLLEVSRPINVHQNVKGKAKARFDDTLHDIYWTEAEDGNGHDGMRVFKGWGRHITRFGMSFEVDEGKLALSPERLSLPILSGVRLAIMTSVRF